MMTYSNVYERFYDDDDTIIIFNMAQNSYYWKRATEDGKLNNVLMNIIVSDDRNKGNYRMAMVWRRGKYLQNLYDEWNLRPKSGKESR